jgi:hypothetical protein
MWINGMRIKGTYPNRFVPKKAVLLSDRFVDDCFLISRDDEACSILDYIY